MLDDCFSFPGEHVRVMRHASVSFRCRDADGRERAFARLPFDLAELVQHEIDHLDGILMVDRPLAAGAR